jgi:hypothetical protein
MGVTMTADTAPRADPETDGAGIDWGAQVRLGLVVSVFAALAAVALAGHVSESVIIIGVIVLATVASWYQMERCGLEHALTRPHRR